jgi:polar amino acid transport system permease protein
LTKRAMELNATTFRPLEIFSAVAVIYFAICWPLTQAIRIWERRLAVR